MLVVVVVAAVAFYLSGGFFISLLFGVIPHPSVSYRHVFRPHFILLAQLQSDTRHFHFNFSRLFIFTSSATVLNGRSLPMGIFYPTPLRL